MINSTQTWVDAAVQEAWTEYQSRKRKIDRTDDMQRYRNDPIAFCQDMFNEIYTDDVEKVAASVRDNTVTIARSANAAGKSHLAARLALWFFSVYEDSKVFITAAPPLENLRHILWGELITAAKRKSILLENCKIKNGNQLGIYRNEQSFIAGVAVPTSGSSEEREAKFSGKHSPHLMFIVDEGDAVPDEVYKGIDSCMSGGELVRLFILFNPRAKVGPVYMKEMKGLAHVVELSAMRHPNVLTGNSVIPGAVTRETTMRRVHMWTRPLSPGEPLDSGNFKVPDFLSGQEVASLDGKFYPPLEEGSLRRIVDPAFSYMVLGQYPAQSSTQLISEEWIDMARARWDLYVSTYGLRPPEGIRPIMGMDMAEYGTDTNIVAMRYGGFVKPMIAWAGMDIDASTIKALHVYIEHNAVIAMIDATGIGSGVAPGMARRGRSDDVRAVSVKVGEKPTPAIKSDIGEFQILKDQLWWAMREWLKNDQTAMLPPDPNLIEELKTISYEVTNYGKIRVTPKDQMRERLKRSPDRADALALTFAPYERARWLKLDV